MNQDVRSGLALVCFGALLGLLWLVLAQSETSTIHSLGSLLGGIGILAAVAGLGFTIKGLVAG